MSIVTHLQIQIVTVPQHLDLMQGHKEPELCQKARPSSMVDDDGGGGSDGNNDDGSGMFIVYACDGPILLCHTCRVNRYSVLG
ncbi:hypothetical protein Ahy_A03g013103 isoform A [Arachis hypogaea]|uniref:Uncharacterized protein n=1 Tax=Arachis hypogaea TaxID=3818 RepID=A0A445DUS4_ARAHY|nr:hypothetical protein Ahy_A03g013103 isoform A [Arachis hypogaea]